MRPAKKGSCRFQPDSKGGAIDLNRPAGWWTANTNLESQFQAFLAEVVLHRLRFLAVFELSLHELFAALAVGFLVPNEFCGIARLESGANIEFPPFPAVF